MSKKQSMRDVQHFGEEGGVVPVIDHAATSTFLDPGDMQKVFEEKLGCYLYSRHSNPTVSAFSQKLAAMEGDRVSLWSGFWYGCYQLLCNANHDGRRSHDFLRYYLWRNLGTF